MTVSSTCSNGGHWMLNDIMWPVQYDMGAKWIRLSGGNEPFHHDTLQWRFVEQRRGQYIIDEKTKAAMAEATANGCKIVVMLTYGNWLHTAEPQKQVLDRRRFPAPFPPAPVTREHIEGYKNWVREMVTQFKGCVEYWEIWNEPLWFGWEVLPEYDQRVRQYCDLVKEVIPVIRKADPDAKVSLAGMGGVPGGAVFQSVFDKDWLRDCLQQGLAPMVDALQWHLQGKIHPDLPDMWAAYPREIRAFQKEAESMGFHGKYMASEYWVGASYPVHQMWGYPPHCEIPGMRTTPLAPLTEMRKAKDTARVWVMNAALNVATFYCNTWWEGPRDAGLFRITWGADPMTAEHPEAAYYVLRTLGTVLEGLRSAQFDVEFSGQTPLECFTFASDDSARVLAVWTGGPSVDKHPGACTDIVVRAGNCHRIKGIDILNGFEQELSFERQEDRVTIPAVVVRDYPLLLRME